MGDNLLRVLDDVQKVAKNFNKNKVYILNLLAKSSFE